PHNAQRHPLEKNTIFTSMGKETIKSIITDDMASIPNLKGINNHMGSKATRHPGHMMWLMQAIYEKGELFFVDSRTTSNTVALKVANENHVPSIPRNIFLDHERNIEAINREFDRMIEHARRTGTALAIGHPYKETLTVLEERLPELEDLQIKLVPVSDMIKLSQKRKNTWQASLSHSPRAAKN
ncbi:MAG: divergent polysaccharide deacetylase family protein, partial [Gammaproteobacteria bacterium]|nr:divergent polysaccharide deacetylase family protein [Gammaproteobacteria bacterium]